MSHLRPKHRCGGAAKAPEQVGEDLMEKKQKTQHLSGAQSGALTSCINASVTHMTLKVKSSWTHTVIPLLLACVK